MDKEESSTTAIEQAKAQLLKEQRLSRANIMDIVLSWDKSQEAPTPKCIGVED